MFKSLLVAVIALVGISSAAFADRAGLHLGLNMATSSAGGAGTDTRFAAGAFYQMPIAPTMWYLQPELNYIGRGTGLDYLSVPILFKAKFDVSAPVKPFVQAGPTLGLKLSGLGANTFDFGLDFGGGLGYDVSPTMTAILDFRYYLGLLNFLDSTVFGANTAQLRGFQLWAGLAFQI